MPIYLILRGAKLGHSESIELDTLQELESAETKKKDSRNKAHVVVMYRGGKKETR